MQGITRLPRRILTALRGQIAATKTSISLKARLARDLLVDMIIKVLFMVISPKQFLDRVSKKHSQPTGLANLELYEAMMYPDDKMELVSVFYDVLNGLWKLDARPTDKQLGRLINREDRVLLLCPRKLVEVLAKGRHRASMITVEDAYTKWQTKHVLVNRLSAPGQKDPFESLPDFGTLVQRGESQDLRLSSHDIFHIRNLKGFLLHCPKIDIGSPTVAGSILKSWMVTLPQILSILKDKPTMRECKTAYWDLVRRGQIGSTVYLQLHGADDPDGSSQPHIPPAPPVQTADTRTIAGLRLATQTVDGGNTTVPNHCSQSKRSRVSTAHSQTPFPQEFSDPDVDLYGNDLNINDPQTYFQKFGSSTPPQKTTNILMALSFFLRPPELDWENLPFPEGELKKSLPKPRRQTPEVFIASRKPDSRMAALSEVTRIATSAVQTQFEASGNSNSSVGRALRSLGETPIQGQLRRTRPTAASNDEMDRLQSPIYHRVHRYGFGSHGPVGHASEQGAAVTDSSNTTPKAGRHLRSASTETTGTVQVHEKPRTDRATSAGANGNGTALNPEAPSFTSITVPSKGSFMAEGGEQLSIPAGAVLGYQNGAAPSDSGYTSPMQRPSSDGGSEASRERSKLSWAGADTDREQGGPELTGSNGHAYH